jgi:hypothetical protein
VTWRKLKDVFKLAGNVQRAEVMQSKDGKSRGMATVSFDTQLEALQAICILSLTFHVKPGLHRDAGLTLDQNFVSQPARVWA